MDSDTSISEPTFPCQVCGKKFDLQSALRMHTIKIHGKQHVEASKAGKKGMQCSTCQRFFPNASSLAGHVQKAHVTDASTSEPTLGFSSFACQVCGKKFHLQSALRMHTIRMHSKEHVEASKPGKKGMHCSTCQRFFPNASSLARHMGQVHVTENTDTVGVVFTASTSKEVYSSSISAMNDVEPDESAAASTDLPTKWKWRRSSVDSPRKKQRHASNQTLPAGVNCGQPDGPSASATGTHERIGRRTRKCHIVVKLRKQLADLKKKCLRHASADGSDPLLAKLTAHHSRLSLEADNIVTEKLPAEVCEVLNDPSKVDDVNRPFTWSKDDVSRLNGLNQQAMRMQTPQTWTWAAKEGTDQYEYNHKRMRFLVEHELETVIKHCDHCKTTGILVGLDQVDSSCCRDCALELDRKSNLRPQSLAAKNKQDAWDEVRPSTEQHHGMPQLYAGDRAVLALVHPVVTVRKNYMVCKKLRQESISLMSDPSQTWTKILPRTDLTDRFVVIERTSKDHTRKHIVANPESVRIWLRHLFQNHPDFIRMQRDGKLQLSDEALASLQSQSELGEVVDDLQYEDDDSDDDADDRKEQNATVVQPAMESGFSSTDVFTFDKYPQLYLKAKDFLKIKEGGQIQIIEDHQRRVPVYNVSATVAFPYLYANGEKSPLDFGDFKMARYLLKKQTLFAYKMADSRYKWEYAEDDVHMMYQYARMIEQTISAKTTWYLQQSPDVAHLPIDQVVEAFKNGFTSQDQSLIDSKLPGLSSVMAKLTNSRERWFAERLGIEAISRDCGDPNVFLTLNNSPRETYDTRLLLHKLQFGEDAEFDPNYFEKNTDKFTELMGTFAPQLSIYLCRKAKMFLKAFLCDICGIQESPMSGDWTQRDQQAEGYYWSRVEFTSTRGVQHWHCLAKLPHVLDTAVIGRMIQNGRVVRQELKCGNIKPGKEEAAWDIIEAGLLANRYATLFADSISTASFYTERMDVDSHDAAKVIDVEKLRKQFVEDYTNDNINMATHPLMRRVCDEEFCDANRNVEMAKVAAVSCIHNCISTICGGDPKDGRGCRFDFPKKTLNHTVPAMMQVNSSQMEARMLLRRTCTRVPNLNEYLLLYWRGNHDMTVLIDASHKMRYATKYAAKSGRYSELLNEIIEYLSQRSVGVMPPSMQIVLSQLLLADVSHRSFMSKQELSYHVMGLPVVRRTFNEVEVVGFYRRSYLTTRCGDDRTIVYSDRTDYSAYAERCNDKTVVSSRKNARPENVLTKDMIAAMTFRDFAETVTHEWLKDTNVVAEDIGSDRRIMTRDVNSGHWVLRRRPTRRHIRFSTVLYTDTPSSYEPVEPGDSTTQTSFFSLPVNKRKQLYRAYMELVCYVPWKDSPEESFLDDNQRSVLEDALQDPEKDHRYSLRRLEMFLEVYKQRLNRGEIAPMGSRWRRDNQYSYTMFLTTQHNVDVHMQRLQNEGTLNARYEADEEVRDTGIELHVDVHDEVDQAEYPSALNFLPPDTFREVIDQKPPELSEVYVGFPMRVAYQKMEEMVKINRSKLFLAQPPQCSVEYNDMTELQRWAVDLGVSMSQQILYLCGKAGCGKTQVALKICEILHGRIQAAAITGKAASLLGAPTVHGMFRWGTYDKSTYGDVATTSTRTLTELQTFYDAIDVFLIDEVNAMSAAMLAQLHETMTKLFNPALKKKDGHELPFGGKKVIFLGDPGQLSPVMGEPIYGGGKAPAAKSARARGARGKRQAQYTWTAKGQELYRKYLETNCVLLRRGQRSSGLLQQICDRVRAGTHTEDDRQLLMCQSLNFPEFSTDFTLHYDNDSCCSTNWHQLWAECKSNDPPRRLHICKASYHTTADNHQLVDGLAALASSKFNFAPDVLCVAVGCDVRLIKNVNVAAGLVNSATGTVVTLLYNNADCGDLLDGKHPPPYCIIVDFPSFQGFLTKEGQRMTPFLNQPHWVPIYREKFRAARSDLPSWIVKKQEPKHCWREQFPLDLCRAMTCHRAQGQTLANCSVSVDLGLDNPDRLLPNDIASILYVALSRATRLQDVFVSYICARNWTKIGASADLDVEERLVEQAKEFGSRNGMYAEVAAELDYEPDYSSCGDEKAALCNGKLLPATRAPVTMLLTDGDLLAQTDLGTFDMSQKAVRKERHIGIDQGRRNFAVVVVDKEMGMAPTVVAAENYDLNLGMHFSASDVLLGLQQHTKLWDWMQQNATQSLPEVDRVIVHIEQMSTMNRHWKQFGIELGQQLQQSVVDEHKCIVKLSHPHLLRAGGVISNLGEKIVAELNLVPVTYGRKRLATAPPQSSATTTASQDSVAEQQHDNSDTDTGDVAADYRQRKLTAANIFRYFINADDSKQDNMQVKVARDVQEMWQHLISQNSSLKLDDVGDALLHALTEVLCGGSQYRQLLPSSISLHNNRTVVVAVCRDFTYWVVVHCTWNTFELEDLGFDITPLTSKYFNSSRTVTEIKEVLMGNLQTALTDSAGSDRFRPVDVVKIVVKQLQGFQDFTREQAGALTESTVKAVKSICDDAAGTNSQVTERNDKSLGRIYIRTDLATGQKFQVVSSAGKLTNAMLSCLNWMHENAKDFVAKRTAAIDERTKLCFFCDLRTLAQSEDSRMEHIVLSANAKEKMAGMGYSVDDSFKCFLAYLILIGINKNEQYVKAVALNYRRPPAKTRTTRAETTTTPTPSTSATT